MASDWNRAVERLLASPLTVNELRLALAVARYTLGWKRRANAIGENLLRDASRITDGRGFARARAGLIEAGILSYTPSGGGRGKRSTYELLLDENPRAHAGVSARENPRAGGTKTPALQRARIEKKGTTSQARPTNITAKTAEAYLTAGGSLELTDWRGALARQAAALAKRGVSERTILTAAAKLGRERGFPGYLTQHADALDDAGGPCSWEGLDRSRLTVEQLSECECARCAEWREHALSGAEKPKRASATETALAEPAATRGGEAGG